MCDKSEKSINEFYRKITINKGLIKEYSYNIYRHSINDFVKNNFINKTHIVYGASGSGKTIFTSMLVLALMAGYPKTFKLVLYAKTEDAISKLSILSNMLKIKEFNINEILSFKNFEEFMDFYNKIHNHNNKKKSRIEELSKQIKDLYSDRQKKIKLLNTLKSKNLNQDQIYFSLINQPFIENIENEQKIINLKNDLKELDLKVAHLTDDIKKLLKSLRKNFYIFYFDDSAEIFLKIKENVKYETFFLKMFPQKRHSNITIIITIQMIKDFITVIKDNTFTISLIGDLPNTSLKKTYDGFSQISKIFSSISKFNLFMNTKKLYFTSEKIVFTFKNCINGNILNGDFIYYHEVDPILVERVTEIENKKKGNLMEKDIDQINVMDIIHF